MARITIISHWCQLIENLQASSLEFYNSVEAVIKRREVPETETSRVEYHESGVLANKRLYLKVERKKLTFEICAAPFGTGFFVSEWVGKVAPGGGILILIGVLFGCFLLFPLLQMLFGAFIGIFLGIVGIPALLLFVGHLISEEEIPGDEALLATPMLGFLYEKIFHPVSYYKFDTMEMYQAAIHNAVTEVIDQISTAKGLRPLTELERKPVIKSFYAKEK